MQPYRPEGSEFSVPSAEALHRGLATQEIFQGMCAKCDEFHNLHIDLGEIRGVIPREEVAPGIAEGKTKEYAILSRVGKPVAFQVLGFAPSGEAILSRKAAILDARSFYLSTLSPGDILQPTVVSAADFGVFCDLGCGYTALMPIQRCCISRLENTSQRYRPGQKICAAVLEIQDATGQIVLTGRELLGTWAENAQNYRQGQTVTGIVRSVMPYGIFVELSPNLSGLAEPTPNVQVGDAVSVYLRAILPEKHKIKMNIIEKLPFPIATQDWEYYITSGHISGWEYYPGSRAVTYF